MVKISTSTWPVLGLMADCFKASLYRRLASSTSDSVTSSERRSLAWGMVDKGS